VGERAEVARPTPPQRIQKVLAQVGIGSRRSIETCITAGRLRVNDHVARLGERIGVYDEVRLDGRLIRLHRLSQAGTCRVLACYKPAGVICSRRDEAGRPTIFEQLPRAFAGRWVSIGRLDLNTSGLMLLTNDGDVAHRLMHPSGGIEREYAVRLLGEVDASVLERLRAGVVLEDGWARFDRIAAAGGAGANRWFYVVLREGRHREVRRLWESQGVRVSRLIRVRFGTVALPRGRRLGEWWELGPEEVGRLLARVEKRALPVA
jgi:23S rRNA pseudouridine2605 synthase